MGPGLKLYPTYLQPAEAGIVVGGAQQTMAGMHHSIVDVIHSQKVIRFSVI